MVCLGKLLNYYSRFSSVASVTHYIKLQRLSKKTIHYDMKNKWLYRKFIYLLSMV